MYYVSSFDSSNYLFGITDTKDGVTEFYSIEQILAFPKSLKIKGVSGGRVQVVDAPVEVAMKSFDKFADLVRQHIGTFSEETCLNLARSASFVRKIKGLDDIDEIRRVTMENIYPPNVQEVVASASQYTNTLREVDCSNPNAIRQALANNVCLVLQHKTNGVLSAFICSGGVAVLDKLYEPGFFDAVYLTKQLYDVTYNIDKVRPMKESTTPKNPDHLRVMSCSLRFRKDGVRHDKDNKVLSSPFYTVNIPRVLAIFILDNPAKLGNRILPEFYSAVNQEEYDFDFNMYRDIKKCLEDGVNYFGSEQNFMKYVDATKITHLVPLTDIIARFQGDFDYMERLRGWGFSFKQES